MARKRKPKRREFTPDEREEVYSLCLRGRLGQLAPFEAERCWELISINSEEYSGISKRAREEADGTVNPLLKKKDD